MLSASGQIPPQSFYYTPLNGADSTFFSDDITDTDPMEPTPEPSPPPSPQGCIARIKSSVAHLWERRPKCPTPDLSIAKQHLKSAIETICQIDWRKQFSSIQQHQCVASMIAQMASSGAGSLALLDDIMKVVSNALSAVKRFFANYSFIQRILQSPKLFAAGLSLPFGLYTLYFSILKFLEDCPDYYEKVYRILEFIEHFGNLFDTGSGFILGLEEAGFISERLAKLVPAMTAVGIAFSLASQVPKAFMWASLKTELATLESTKFVGLETQKKRSIKNPKILSPEEERTRQNDLLVLNKLNYITSEIDGSLLNRLFALNGQTFNSSHIISKIQLAKKSADVGSREKLLTLLKGRIQTRIDSLALSLTTTIISAIGLGILVFTPYTLFAHLTLLITAVITIKYMQNERRYALEFQKNIKD